MSPFAFIHYLASDIQPGKYTFDICCHGSCSYLTRIYIAQNNINFWYGNWENVLQLFLIQSYEIPHVISSIFMENPSPGIANFVTSLEQTNYWSWDTEENNLEYFLFEISISLLDILSSFSLFHLWGSYLKKTLKPTKFCSSLWIHRTERWTISNHAPLLIEWN